MDTQKIRKKSVDELQNMIDKLRLQIAGSYLEMRMGKLKNVREPRRLRKELAMLCTMLRQKEQDNLSYEKGNE